MWLRSDGVWGLELMSSAGHAAQQVRKSDTLDRVPIIIHGAAITHVDNIADNCPELQSQGGRSGAPPVDGRWWFPLFSLDRNLLQATVLPIGPHHREGLLANAQRTVVSSPGEQAGTCGNQKLLCLDKRQTRWREKKPISHSYP